MTVEESRMEGLADSGVIRKRWTDADAPDQDPIASMHDTTEEVGDEAGLRDTYLMDVQEAEELGVALDPADTERPNLA